MEAEGPLPDDSETEEEEEGFGRCHSQHQQLKKRWVDGWVHAAGAW